LFFFYVLESFDNAMATIASATLATSTLNHRRKHINWKLFKNRNWKRNSNVRCYNTIWQSWHNRPV